MQNFFTSTLFFLLSISLLFFVSCNEDKMCSSEVMADDTVIQVPRFEVSDIKASVINTKDASWKVTENQLKSAKNIVKSEFWDDKNGWIISKDGDFWKTSDAGKTWNSEGSIQKVAEGFSISDTHFINSTTGFVSANNPSESVNGINDTSIILRTRDSGENWVIIYREKAVFLRSINFTNEYEGWAVGRKSTYDSSYHRNRFALHTINQGENWIDVSGKLNELAVDERGNVNDDLTDVYSKDDNKASVLSLRGGVFQTIDGGKSWQLTSFLPAEPKQTCICHLGKLETGEIWVAGGTISIEGQWGMLAITQSDSLWRRSRLGGVYFADVEILSTDEVIAVGSIVAPNNFGRANELNKGVILYSLDSGKSWTIVHQSQASSEFTSIAKLSENKVFVAGKNGVCIYLERDLGNSKN